jgi:hypothetical protein
MSVLEAEAALAVLLAVAGVVGYLWLRRSRRAGCDCATEADGPSCRLPDQKAGG